MPRTGLGSTFLGTFLCRTSQWHSAAIQTTPRNGSQTGPMTTAQNDADIEATLLVVDDEPNIRELLSTSLRFAGFDVVSAANGAEALRLAEQTDVDLLVLPPDLDGFTLTRRRRQIGMHAPGVFRTARAPTSDKRPGLTVRGDDYVTKPFSLEEVVARTRAGLRRTRSLEDEENAVIVA